MQVFLRHVFRISFENLLSLVGLFSLSLIGEWISQQAPAQWIGDPR
jgi:hypothetical protein